MRTPDVNLWSPHVYTYTQNMPVPVLKVPEVRSLHWGSGAQDIWKKIDLCSKEEGVEFGGEMGRGRASEVSVGQELP